jgi:hypothetical protein
MSSGGETGVGWVVGSMTALARGTAGEAWEGVWLARCDELVGESAEGGWRAAPAAPRAGIIGWVRLWCPGRVRRRRIGVGVTGGPWLAESARARLAQPQGGP